MLERMLAIIAAAIRKLAAFSMSGSVTPEETAKRPAAISGPAA